MREFAKALFDLAIGLLTFVLVVVVAAIVAVMAAVVGFVVFDPLLGGWMLTAAWVGSALIAFALTVFLAWGFSATIDDAIDAFIKLLR